MVEAVVDVLTDGLLQLQADTEQEMLAKLEAEALVETLSDTLAMVEDEKLSDLLVDALADQPPDSVLKTPSEHRPK